MMPNSFLHWKKPPCKIITKMLKIALSKYPNTGLI